MIIYATLWCSISWQNVRSELYHLVCHFEAKTLFIKEAVTRMKGKTGGIKINGRRMHSNRFADDIVLVADVENDMNHMVGIFDIIRKIYKLRMYRLHVGVQCTCFKMWHYGLGLVALWVCLSHLVRLHSGVPGLISFSCSVYLVALHD